MPDSLEKPKLPVILDTDIGADIDDTWALALLLKCPELDLRLVTTCSGDTHYRARLVARLLEIAGRADVAIGMGPRRDDLGGPQAPWMEGYALTDYPGPVYADGVNALVETILGAEQPVTLIGIGPAQNIAAALERAPRIAEKARLVGMYGSLRLGYNGRPEADPEYNVYAAPDAFRQALAAPWLATITPLDTCGLVKLTGSKYQAILDNPDPLARAVIENYRVWRSQIRQAWAQSFDPALESTTLFDTVAVYLALSEALLEMETLGVRVTKDGYTRIDPQASPVRCATGWKDLGAFEDWLVGRLLGR